MKIETGRAAFTETIETINILFYAERGNDNEKE